MKYEYVDLKDSSAQYEDYEKGRPVEARYIPAKIEADKGNPFVEALPLPRTEEEVLCDYNTILPSYSYDKTTSMSKLNKMLSVGLLKSIRFPLPFHNQLEFSFYNALLTSYRARKPLFSDNNSIPYYYENQKCESKGVLLGDAAEATNAGFSLVGYSGCGKSSAIKILVSHYPQVIIHHFGIYGTFPQITYLVVNCIPNSNFGALYESIGDAIDKAMGNIEPVYALEINKARNLGAKAEKVRALVERFAVGIIIFDEIQLINFEHTKENTFDSLLTLANRTKTAIAVVGTEDAKEKMFGELRTARRLGTVINGNNYCKSRKFFDILAGDLFRYQWFDQPISYTKEIGDTLFDLTKGIIDQLISIYSAVQIEYLHSTKKPVVDGEYFRKVARKYYSGIQDVLANLENTENVSKLNEIRLIGAQMQNTVIDEERQKAQAEKIIEAQQERAQNNIDLYNITNRIKGLFDDFSDEQIQEAYKKVIAKKTSQGKSEKEIARLVIEKLQSTPKKKPVKGSKIAKMDTGEMRSYLGLDKKEEQ